MATNFGINPIGANTIAITADNKILIQKQADDARTNPGRLMPSGSGVGPWHDYAYDDGSKATTLSQIVTHCAEYKLAHECSLPEECTMETKLLGIARVPAGFKPDFYCFTQPNMAADELKTAGATPYELLGAETGISAALFDYIEKANAVTPSSVALQLYLEACFMAEFCRSCIADQRTRLADPLSSQNLDDFKIGYCT